MDTARTDLLQALINCQSSLYAYIWKLLPNTHEAKEVLQKTNVLLLEKLDEWPTIHNFGAWAARHAYFQVLAHRKTMQRNKLIFNDELLYQLAHTPQTTCDDPDDTLRALGQCLDKLPPQERTLIKKRYEDNLPLEQLGSELKRSSGAIATALYRIRRALMNCVAKTLGAEGASS